MMRGLKLAIVIPLIITGLLIMASGKLLWEAFFIVMLPCICLIEIPILFGTLLGYTPMLTEFALEAHTLRREQRNIKHAHELVGGLDVATRSTSGDVSMAQETGGLAIHEEVTTDSNNTHSAITTSKSHVS